jgi:hypothetical protein
MIVFGRIRPPAPVTEKGSSRKLLTFLRLQRLPGGSTPKPRDLPSPSFLWELSTSFTPSYVGPRLLLTQSQWLRPAVLRAPTTTQEAAA